MKKIVKLLGLIGLTIIGIGAIKQYQEYKERHNSFEVARFLTNIEGKPLLVIGGPYGSPVLGFINRILPSLNLVHDCGDVCLDINSKSCNPCNTFTQGDVRSIPYTDKFFGVVYIAHVLEHLETIENLKNALSELQRVADNVIIVIPIEFGQATHFWGHRLNLGFGDGGLLVQEIEGGRTEFIPIKNLIQTSLDITV